MDYDNRPLSRAATAIQAAQTELAIALMRSPVADYAEYRAKTGEWRGMQKALDTIEKTQKEDR